MRCVQMRSGQLFMERLESFRENKKKEENMI